MSDKTIETLLEKYGKWRYLAGKNPNGRLASYEGGRVKAQILAYVKDLKDASEKIDGIATKMEVK